MAEFPEEPRQQQEQRQVQGGGGGSRSSLQLPPESTANSQWLGSSLLGPPSALSWGSILLGAGAQQPSIGNWNVLDNTATRLAQQQQLLQPPPVPSNHNPPLMRQAQAALSAASQPSGTASSNSQMSSANNNFSLKAPPKGASPQQRKAHAGAAQRPKKRKRKAPPVQTQTAAALSLNNRPATPQPPTPEQAASMEKALAAVLDQDTLSRIKRVRTFQQQDIDLYAPDPEKDAPPGETEHERKKRLERINGRRKRTKKFIEIDQYGKHITELYESNQSMAAENKAFRERIALLRPMLERGGETLNNISRDLLCLPDEKKPAANKYSRSSETKRPAKEGSRGRQQHQQQQRPPQQEQQPQHTTTVASAKVSLPPADNQSISLNHSLGSITSSSGAAQSSLSSLQTQTAEGRTFAANAASPNQRLPPRQASMFNTHHRPNQFSFSPRNTNRSSDQNISAALLLQHLNNTSGGLSGLEDALLQERILNEARNGVQVQSLQMQRMIASSLGQTIGNHHPLVPQILRQLQSSPPGGEQSHSGSTMLSRNNNRMQADNDNNDLLSQAIRQMLPQQQRQMQLQQSTIPNNMPAIGSRNRAAAAGAGHHSDMLSPSSNSNAFAFRRTSLTHQDPSSSNNAAAMTTPSSLGPTTIPRDPRAPPPLWEGIVAALAERLQQQQNQENQSQQR